MDGFLISPPLLSTSPLNESETSETMSEQRTTIRRYQCSHCHRTFGKAEHLHRHEQTHTGLRPFACTHCRRRFGRQDALTRHQRRYGHGESSTVSTGTARCELSMLETSHPSGRDESITPVQAQGISSSATAEEGLAMTDDQFLEINWLDSEDLLQTILSSEFPDVSVSHFISSGQAASGQPATPWLASNDGLSEGRYSAVQNLRQIITAASTDVTSEAQTAGLMTVFLDGCLRMFFTRFIPSFPVVHAPTFTFKDWTHPLLLNAIALGSLFTGQKDDIDKGEILWRLAHTAVTTSWHDLIKHKGPYDSCCGVQLVLTALLGQVYATLSRNVTLRRAAKIFHSLGFYWARETRMYEIDSSISLDPPNTPTTPEDKLHTWKRWAARETQLRALLGHYILDGLIAHYAGGTTSQRHAHNPLPPACAETLFEASNFDDWFSRMQTPIRKLPPFREYFNCLFSQSVLAQSFGFQPLSLSGLVVLEGLNSLVLERNNSSLVTVGIPSRLMIAGAVGSFHEHIITCASSSASEKLEVLLRWHTICLDAATDSAILCRSLCDKYGIEQRIFGGDRPIPNFQPTLWAKSPDARQALLHDIAIGDTLQLLPIGRSHPFHVPSAIFAAAVTCCGFLLAGISIMAIPCQIDW
ncbi:C2H2 type zinc finger domain protein [Ilyonectria robusta]